MSNERVTRYAWLLAAIVVLLAVPSVTPGLEGPIPALEIASTAVLAAALWSAGRSPRTVWIGLALVVPALVVGWTAWAQGSRPLDVVAETLSAAFLGFVTAVLFGALLRSRRITTDTILGGISVYLLVGVVFAKLYVIVEKTAPGSLLEHGGPLASPADGTGILHLPQLLYYSFVTLSTLGYGDIVPVSDAARVLSAMEAVTGQIYIAVFVARLVALHVGAQSER